MGRRIVVIASGETERLSLPHLLRNLIQEGLELLEVRIPRRHGRLDVQEATNLINAEWYSRTPAEQPDKFVVLVDADREDSAAVTASFIGLTTNPPVAAVVRVCAAKWHLEAWFFADPRAIRDVIGRDLGRVEEAVPDDIADPKRRLMNLNDGIYTARLAAEIAKRVRPPELLKSPSFAAFAAAMRNGHFDRPA